MLLPASGPKSSCTALNLRFSEENWLRTPWADSRTVGLTDSSIAASNIHGPTVRPSDRPTRLVESLNGRSREISSEDLAILLSRARPADRAPLTQPQAVTRARAGGDEPRDLAVLTGHRQLERRALQQAIGLGPQHGPDVGPGHSDVAVLEHDAQLAHAPGGTGMAHHEVRDALQPIAADVHDRRQRPRQYSAQLGAVPFLAPAKPWREVAIGAPPAARVGHRPQVGSILCRFERLLERRRGAAAGGVKVGLDDRAVVLEHLAAGPAYRAPHFGRFSRDAVVQLVAHVRPRVEPERLPAAAVLQGEAARYDRLGEQRLLLVVAPDADFASQHARQIALDGHAVQHRQSGGVPDHVHAAAVAAAGRHREAPLGNADRGEPHMACTAGAVRPDDVQPTRIGHDRPGGAGGDGAEGLAVAVVRDEQFAVTSQRDARCSDRESDAQLRLHAGSERRRGALRWRAGRGRQGEDASEPAPRPGPRRVVRW